MMLILGTYKTKQTHSLEVNTHIGMEELCARCLSKDGVPTEHYGLMAQCTESVYGLQVPLWVVVPPTGLAREHGFENNEWLRGLVMEVANSAQELRAFATQGCWHSA
jgi:hypothetical protein